MELSSTHNGHFKETQVVENAAAENMSFSPESQVIEELSKIRESLAQVCRFYVYYRMPR